MIFKRESSFKELYYLNDMEASFTDDLFIWRIWYRTEDNYSLNRKSFTLIVVDEYQEIRFIYSPKYVN